MARPRLSRAELRAAGATNEELLSWLAPDARQSDTGFWPWPKAWPMGFSWASYVAQESALGILRKAGISESRAIAATVPMPEDLDLAFGLAADDMMLLSDAGPGALAPWVAKLESTKRTAAGIADLPDDQWMQLDDGTDRSDDLLFRPLRIEELP